MVDVEFVRWLDPLDSCLPVGLPGFENGQPGSELLLARPSSQDQRVFSQENESRVQSFRKPKLSGVELSATELRSAQPKAET